MKLLLLADDGTVLDSTDEFTREEWVAMSLLGKGSVADELNVNAR